MSSYLLSGQSSELERLQLQSRVWERAGAALLADLPARPGARALDAGCGVMGWLRVLSRWVGADGAVTGTDLDDGMLAKARAFVEAEALGNVSLVRDDLFASALPPASFDLVHARFQLAPLGRQRAQVEAYLALLRPGGVLVLEDPDTGSWHFNPPAPGAEQLIALIERTFLAGGGDFNAGRTERALLEELGLQPDVRTHVLALAPGHPYLRLPLQFATALRQRMESIAPAEHIDALMAQATREIESPGRWGTTFTLVQTWAVRR